MKKILLSLFVLIFFSCKEKDVLLSSLIERNGVVFQVNKTKPYSGKIHSKHKNQQYETLGIFKKGLRSGLWESFSSNGKIKERINFKEGKKHGKYELFSEKNSLLRLETYNHGLKEGEFKEFDVNGIIKLEGLYKNGKRHGVWTQHNLNKSFRKTTYNLGLRDGLFEKYDKGKKNVLRGMYRKDKKDSEWQSLYTNGEKQRIEIYEKDKIIRVKNWNKDGIIQYEATYPGLTIWYKKGKKIAEAKFINQQKLESQKSIKIKFDSNTSLVSPYKILNNSVWKGNKRDLNMKYINTRKKGFYKKFAFDSKSYRRNIFYINGYNRSRTGTENSGNWKINEYVLPSLLIDISGGQRKESIFITDLSQNKVKINNNTYTRTDKLFD